MNGNELTWQSWKMHVGFNYREGIVLSTVQYFDRDEDRYRPIFYRASFAEMVVPYAAPEWPHPRKFAFDVGEYGLGMMANSLELGCTFFFPSSSSPLPPLSSLILCTVSIVLVDGS
jgi:primary-amine oxidase